MSVKKNDDGKTHTPQHKNQLNKELCSTQKRKKTFGFSHTHKADIFIPSYGIWYIHTPMLMMGI